MHTLMHACDIVVQSGGGMTSLEALATGTPVITYRCLPGHGRTSAEALDLAGWAPWVRDRAALADALKHTCAPPAIERVDFAQTVRELVGLRATRPVLSPLQPRSEPMERATRA